MRCGCSLALGREEEHGCVRFLLTPLSPRYYTHTRIQVYHSTTYSIQIVDSCGGNPGADANELVPPSEPSNKSAILLVDSVDSLWQPQCKAIDCRELQPYCTPSASSIGPLFAMPTPKRNVDAHREQQSVGGIWLGIRRGRRPRRMLVHDLVVGQDRARTTRLCCSSCWW
jgi:hypothetical protein